LVSYSHFDLCGSRLLGSAYCARYFLLGNAGRVTGHLTISRDYGLDGTVLKGRSGNGTTVGAASVAGHVAVYPFTRRAFLPDCTFKNPARRNSAIAR
jgi:hypothetical protein